MKIKSIFPITLISFFILIIIFYYRQNRTDWKGTIKKVDGITIIENPRKPIFGADVFHLKEELSIGEREQEEGMFSLLSLISVDDKGYIYALDYKEKHIKIFNEDGQYKKTFGGSGQGPGEIAIPKYMTVSKQNEIILVDSNKISFFSLEGEFKRQIPCSNFGMRVDFYETDRISNIYVYLFNAKTHTRELQKFDSTQKFIKTIDVSPLSNLRNDGYNPLHPELIFYIASDDRIICGYNDKYEIKVYNPTCILQRKILKKHDPVGIYCSL